MGSWISKKFYTEYWDCITGELKKIEALAIKKKEYDVYMKIYHENLKRDKNFPNSREMEVLIELMDTVKFNSCNIYISSGIIKILSEKTKKQPRTINKVVESLINKKIILYQSYGSHKLNPVYYFYGTEDERKKCLEELKHEVEPLMVAEKESQYSKPITDFDTVSSKK